MENDNRHPLVLTGRRVPRWHYHINFRWRQAISGPGSEYGAAKAWVKFFGEFLAKWNVKALCGSGGAPHTQFPKYIRPSLLFYDAIIMLIPHPLVET